jgi:hypothetical protein
MRRVQHNPKLDYQVATGYPTMGRREDNWNVTGDTVGDSGVWAVNRQMSESEPGEMDYGTGWNVTHVPTGFTLLSGLPTRKLALAIAERVEALGWGSVTTSDPSQAAQQLAQLGASELKTMVIQATFHAGSQMAPDKLQGKIAKWKPGQSPARAEVRAAKRATPTPQARRRKAPPKPRSAKKAPAGKSPTGKKKKPTAKKPLKKRAKTPKATTSKAAPASVDLLEMARRARGENPEHLDESRTSAKARCLW